MIEKILVSVGVIFYALVVPFFEISD
ncbi:MAG: hypothetical protein ACI9ES_002654, partial [Oceanospirillaceae bacterium]